MNEQTQAIISIDEKRKFLKNHFRYDTMQSWNKVKSFAAKVKLNNIYDAVKVPSEAFDFLDCQELYGYIHFCIQNFTDDMNGNYTIIFNGRSNGYLVLVNSKKVKSEYKSFCPDCSQRSYATVLKTPSAEASSTGRDKLKNYIATHNNWYPHIYLLQSDARNLFPMMTEKKFVDMVTEIKEELKKEFGDTRNFSNGICGKCGSRNCKNFETPIEQLEIHAGKSFGDDIDGLEQSELEEMYDVVKAFDRTVEDCITTFKEFVQGHTMEEREVMVSQKIKVPVQRKAKV